MNAPAIVASCALLGTLSLPFLSGPATALSSAGIPSSAEGATIVIRYDPEAIFLTHELVAPLFSREVELGEDPAGAARGELVMEPMESNPLQPKGVFVGRIRLAWYADSLPSPEQREALFDKGLEQLCSALSERIVQPRRRQLARRIAVLEAMENDLRVSADVQAQELARREQLVTMRIDLDESKAQLRSRDLELRAAQQDLLMATAGVQEGEAKLDSAKATVRQATVEMDRVRALVEKQVSSGFELQAAEKQLQVARNEVQIAAARVDSQRMQIDQHQRQIHAVEDALAQLQAEMNDLQVGIASLSSEVASGPDATLRLGQTTDRARLTELGAELQEARAALATIPDVSIERW